MHMVEPAVDSTLPHPAANPARKIDWSAVDAVLVVRADNLGDVISLTPALRSLRQSLSQARIDLLTSPVGATLSGVLPDVDTVWAADVPWQQVGDAGGGTDPSAVLKLAERIRENRYDVLVVSTSFSQSPWPAAMLGLMAGVPIRIGHSREFGGNLLTHWYWSLPPGTHQVDRNVQLLAAAGIEPAGATPALAVPERARRRAASLLAGAGIRRPYVAALPGASCAARRYPPDRWRTVVTALAERGCGVLVIGTAREQRLVAEVAQGTPAAQITGLTTPDMVALIEQVEVAITNNSGGMWVAEAVDTPVVVLYGGSEYVSELAPRRAPSVILKQPTACSPCRQFTCPFGLECLDIEPQRVVDAATRLIPMSERLDGRRRTAG